MTDNKLIGYTLINDLETLLKSINKSKCKVTTTEEVYTLSSEHFIMSYSIPDNHFYLTFSVGLDGFTIGNDMKVICQIFEPDEFTMLEDSYIDKDRGLVFGVEALACKHNETITNSGRFKCPLCDKIYKMDKIADNGYCVNCNPSELTWN